MSRFQKFADAVLQTIQKVEAKKGRLPEARAIVRELNGLVTSAYDATAQQMMEGEVPNADKLYGSLTRRYQKILEKWFVMHQLGVGNDLNAGSDGNELEGLAVEPVEGMAKALPPPAATDPKVQPAAPEVGTAVTTQAFKESIKRYVDRLLTETDDIVPDTSSADEKPLADDADVTEGKACKCGKDGCVCEDCDECNEMCESKCKGCGMTLALGGKGYCRSCSKSS